MPPLTLEQVLARSMRLPRQRTQNYVSKLYRGGDAAAAAAPASSHTQRATQATAALVTELSDTGLFQPSHTDIPAATRSGRGFGSTRTPTSTAAPTSRQQKLNFFELMDREDASRQAGRLSIHRSGHLVRNGTDLTTFLNAALRTGDWEGGLRAFVDATALPALKAMLPTSSSPVAATTTPVAGAHMSDDVLSGGAGGHRETGTAAPLSVSGVNPNLDHVRALLDMCAQSGQLPLVERIGAFFAPAFPEAFAHAVELIAASSSSSHSNNKNRSSVSVNSVDGRRRDGDDSNSEGGAASALSSTPGWRVAFAYLTQRCPLPAAEIPVEAFNVCLRGCEEARDWRGAMEVVRAMGPNPLQGWTASGEKKATEAAATSSDTPLSSSSSASSATSEPPALTSVSTPPSPNVVSYATLIATLEQARKDQIASEVLNRLPAVEKEEITASYAALIFVWSNQVLKKRRRRF